MLDPLPSLLENIAVELLLPVAKEFPDHLPAQALALQDKVSYPDWCVREEPPLDQVLDPFLWLPAGEKGCRVTIL